MKKILSRSTESSISLKSVLLKQLIYGTVVALLAKLCPFAN